MIVSGKAFLSLAISQTSQTARSATPLSPLTILYKLLDISWLSLHPPSNILTCSHIVPPVLHWCPKVLRAQLLTHLSLPAFGLPV